MNKTGIRLILLAAAAAPLFGQGSIPVNLSGLVTDTAGAPVAAVAVRLENGGLAATTGADGRFTLSGGTGIGDASPRAPFAALHGGALFLSLPERSTVTYTAYGLEGRALFTEARRLESGSHSLSLPRLGSGVRFFKVKTGTREMLVRSFALDGALRGAGLGARESGLTRPGETPAPAKRSAGVPYYDVISASKTGFLKSYVSITTSDSGSIRIKLLGANSPKFSFFLTSMKGLQTLSKNDKGFGGDFRFGETGAGAGLRGADKICAALAEASMPNASFKGWRAFLSVTADAHGKQVDAIDRVGPGPWHDRLGRLLAPTLADLRADRPQNGDVAIRNDLPNEAGVPNHKPDPTGPLIDNHRTVTGSNTAGKLKSATSTCKDWTIADGAAANGKPGCGLAWPRGSGTSNSNWISALDTPGCAPGYEFGLPTGATIIGGGGGYGGFYCFALTP